MRNLNFHLIKAQNILCFGEKGIEVHFRDFGNIVQVCGINLDMPGTEEHPASNASGKSSIQELLSIGLYGRTVKSPTKNKGNEIINVLADKGTIEIQWDDYRVVRTYTKSASGLKGSLKAWKSPNKIWDKTSELDRTPKVLQAEIEKFVGLSHHSFCNVVIFDDSREYCFLEADTPKKREIIENLLDLDQYREYHENAKAILKDIKSKHDGLLKEYARLLDEVETAKVRVKNAQGQEEQWRQTKARQCKEIEDRIGAKQKQLNNTDTGAQLEMWQAAQERIAELNREIEDLASKRERGKAAIEAAKPKLLAVREERDQIKEEIITRRAELQVVSQDHEKTLKLIDKLENLKDGTTCPYCHGIVGRHNHQHVLDESRERADKLLETITRDGALLKGFEEGHEKKTASIGVMEERLREADGKIKVFEAKERKAREEASKLLLLPKPEGTVAEQVLEAEIVELKKQLKERQEESKTSPYSEIIDQAEGELTKKEQDKDQKAAELQEAEGEIPYYQFWVEAFGDNGIRKFVIDGIIPSLNDRVAYWMDILCDGLIELEFDNKLDATITRKGNPASYHNASNGERQRINLAVSQAFAYVMMLNSGVCPNIVFLDEVTGGGIDRAGVSGVYNMIFELAKERQVFVTTHNEILMTMLQGCETLTLKKQNDITVLAC